MAEFDAGDTRTAGGLARFNGIGTKFGRHTAKIKKRRRKCKSRSTAEQLQKKRNGTVHTFRQKNIAPAGEPTVRPHAAKPNARRKTGRTPQSRTPTAKPNADGKAGRRRQNENRAPLRTLCLSSGCASPYLTSIWRVAAAVSSIFFLGMSMVITPFSTLAEIFSRSILSGSSRLCWNCV